VLETASSFRLILYWKRLSLDRVAVQGLPFEATLHLGVIKAERGAALLGGAFFFFLLSRDEFGLSRQVTMAPEFAPSRSLPNRAS
jgi:hypothetical protein